MKRAWRGSLIGGISLLIGISILIVATRSHPTDASSPFSPHPLAGMSADEIIQYALSWTKANDQIVINGSPTVKVSRPLKDGDVANFGDFARARADEYVVVLEGDFLVSPGAGGPTIAINSDPSPAKYLTEVFNQSGALVAFGHGPALPILPQSELPAAGTQTAALNDPPAPLSTPPSSGIGPGWTTPPTRIATSAP